LASRATAEENKAFGQYQAAAQNEQRVIAKITDQASNNKQYLKDLDAIKTAEMTAIDDKKNFDPAKIPAQLRRDYDAAKLRIAEQEKVWNKQKEAAARDTELAYSRINIKPEAAATTTPAPANAPRPQNRPSLNDPSLQK
jgi:hypothetical protein